MALAVNTNVSSLNAQRQLVNSGNSLDTSFKRLSSGLRINSAADDSAGLQISNRLSGQINGLNQGIRNANDGISLAQQASNGSNVGEDRKAIQDEIRSLMKEVNRVAADTTFGGQNLLNGSYKADFQVGADAAQVIGFSMKSVGSTAATNSISANKGFTLSGIAGVASVVTGKTLSASGNNISTVLGTTTTNKGFKTVFKASSISVSTQANAQFVFKGMDSLIAVVDKKRAELGAVQNRFQSTIRNQANIAENLSAARSRIQDSDFAAETAALTRSQILQQASTSILSQANQRPQVALSLLG